MTNYESKKLATALTDCGKALLQIAEALTKQKDNTPVAEAKSKKEEKALTLEDVRKVAADKSRQGFTKEVRALIQKHGANNLSGVDAAQYSALLKELGVLNHAE